MILRFFALRMGILNTQTSEFGMEIAEALGYPKDRFPKLGQSGTI